MQLLSCDLWLMERSVVKHLIARALQIGPDKLPEPRSEGPMIEHVAAKASESKRAKAVAVIPVNGPLEARPTELGAWLGMSSYEVIGKVLDHFVQDDTVGGIILDVCSPGGMVYGAQELADKIYQARGAKPIVAVANPLAASGAYWIAAAAGCVVVTTSGDVGSVGVITEHVDASKAYEKQGVTVSTITSAVSPFKGEYSETSPLTDETKQYIQSRVDAISNTFVGDLARFRGYPTAHVAENFGKGRIVPASQAKAAGMVDKVFTMDEVKTKMLSGRLRINSESAMYEWDFPTEREVLKQRVEAIMAKANVGAEINAQS